MRRLVCYKLPASWIIKMHLEKQFAFDSGEKIDVPRVFPRVLKFISPRFTRVSRYTSWECEAAVMWNMIYRRVTWMLRFTNERDPDWRTPNSRKEMVLICDDLFLTLLINSSPVIDSCCVNRDNFCLLFMKYTILWSTIRIYEIYKFLKYWNFPKNNKIRIYLSRFPDKWQIEKKMQIYDTLKIWA